ncbi:GNAT family N-acetyltransferase [Pseudarthrobacter sp. J1738]|uniref:GNAT family N-acetyltransferase n=1 Tax=unclassified Pseudarthrobacter TaxID=2647000 RepID=UPI003D2825B1
MTSLITPDASFHSSWVEAFKEFDGAQLDGAGAEGRTDEELTDPKAFGEFVDSLVADALPDSPRKPGYVPCTYLWMVDTGTFVGSLAIRHELNDFLFNDGGHIGYSVRPSARRRGYASAALAEALPLAADLGISRVLVTCDEDNVGSRATIEKNGGVYEDSRNGKRRYWIEASV